MDLNARVEVNCGRKDEQTDGRTDRWMENRTPILHLAKAGVTTRAVIRQHSSPGKAFVQS